ncbi:hypothetical protein [Parasitella parasitica]|uniref:Uncharacterized protein n=1 Tax=Parasitella parasitica TaxID=35722 RepID=A0A0B7MV59_9FUNG|nr:hypothetical protein [Parasitella parasitica]
MHEVNPFDEMFKTMQELSAEQPGGLPDLRMIFHAESTPDEKRYNRPSSSEIGVLFVGGDDKDNGALPSIAKDEDATDGADQLEFDANRGTRKQPSKKPKNQFELFREPVPSVYSRHVSPFVMPSTMDYKML